MNVRFISIEFLSLLEDFTRGCMDLYQGSLPRKFISFRLGVVPMEGQTPNPDAQATSDSNLEGPPITFCGRRSDYDSDTGSEDVNQYAEEMTAKLGSGDDVPKTPSNEEENPETSGQVEVIEGTAVPAIPHHVVLTTSGPNRNGLELVFPPQFLLRILLSFAKTLYRKVLMRNLPKSLSIQLYSLRSK